MTAALHTRLATQLFRQAMGDLILDPAGDVCYRDRHDLVTMRDLPFAQHRPGMRLACTTPEGGWQLTPDGAQFILEHCPPDRWTRPGRRDVKFLEQVAKGA